MTPALAVALTLAPEREGGRDAHLVTLADACQTAWNRFLAELALDSNELSEPDAQLIEALKSDRTTRA